MSLIPNWCQKAANEGGGARGECYRLRTERGCPLIETAPKQGRSTALAVSMVRIMLTQNTPDPTG